MARKRKTNRTPERPSGEDWKPAFLRTLAETGVVTVSADAAGISRSVAYLEQDSDPAFAEAWQDALERACDALELEVRKRAVEGIAEPVIYKGEAMGRWVNAKGDTVPKGTKGATFSPLVIRRPDTSAAFRILAANRREKWSERFQFQHGGDPNNPIRHSVIPLSKLPLEFRVKLLEAIEAEEQGQAAGGSTSVPDK